MSVLDRAALLAAASRPLPIELVEVPELGGAVYIRGMSGSERDGWEKSLLVGKGKRRDVDTTNVRAKLVCKVACDEAGKPLFQAGDAALIGNLRVDVLNKLFEVAQRLSGVSDADVDELGKASAPEAGSDSPTS